MIGFAVPVPYDERRVARVGDEVILAAGISEKRGLKAGEVATISRLGDAQIVVQNDQGRQLGYFESADLGRPAEGCLPLHAALYLRRSDATSLAVLRGHPQVTTRLTSSMLC